MERYYVSKNNDDSSEGCYEVHVVSCKNLPSKENRIFLGYHEVFVKAITEAEKYYPGNVCGCINCIPEWQSLKKFY